MDDFTRIPLTPLSAIDGSFVETPDDFDPVIYVIVGPLVKKELLVCYTGQSSCPVRRAFFHSRDAALGDKRPLYEAMRKHGSERFLMFIVARFPDETALDQEEQRVLRAIQGAGFRTWNIASAGNRQGSWSQQVLDREPEPADIPALLSKLIYFQRRIST